MPTRSPCCPRSRAVSRSADLHRPLHAGMDRADVLELAGRVERVRELAALLGGAVEAWTAHIVLHPALPHPRHGVADGDLHGARLEGIVDDLDLALGGGSAATVAAATARASGERQQQQEGGRGVTRETPGHPKRASKIR